MINSITLGNNKNYNFAPLGNSFIDKIHKFFLTISGLKVNLVVLDPENRCNKVYTISKNKYEKILRRAVEEETFASQSLSPKVIKIIVNSVIKQTRVEGGIVVSNQLKQFTTPESFKHCIYDFLKSNSIFEDLYGSNTCDKLKDLGFLRKEAKQKFLLAYAQSSPEAADMMLNFLLNIAKKDAQVQSYGYSGYDYLPDFERIKVVFGVKDFILEKDKSKVRSFLSNFLENIAKTNPVLTQKIKDNLKIISQFSKSVYTHSSEYFWYDGDGSLRRNQMIRDTVYCGVKGGFLDHLEFLQEPVFA